MEEKKKERKNAGEDDIIIPYPGKIHLTRCYNYIPYTHWRIKRILKKEYNMELVPIWSYKSSQPGRPPPMPDGQGILRSPPPFNQPSRPGMMQETIIKHAFLN